MSSFIKFLREDAAQQLQQAQQQQSANDVKLQQVQAPYLTRRNNLQKIIMSLSKKVEQEQKSNKTSTQQTQQSAEAPAMTTTTPGSTGNQTPGVAR